jgi:hypothetical protein
MDDQIYTPGDNNIFTTKKALIASESSRNIKNIKILRSYLINKSLKTPDMHKCSGSLIPERRRPIPNTCGIGSRSFREG